MRNAIITRCLAPTNTKGCRTVAKTPDASVTLPYDYSLTEYQNHLAAAYALLKKLNQDGYSMVAGMTENGYAFVSVKGDV